MSMENVKEFLALVKTDEGLARKVVELKDSLQDGSHLKDEKEILAEKVLPLAKAHGLDFTADEFLAYANSVSGELSDDDLLNVSGGISARGVALGLLFATGLSFVPTIVSSFAIGGGSAPETSISQSYDAGDSLQQDDEIDIDNREDDPASPQLQAAREKVKRLQQELSRKKRGKSNVSKGYRKTFQELEKAKANVERLEKIELEKTEKGQQESQAEMKEVVETNKGSQDNLGVSLVDNETEEKHEERQAENKEEELKKNEGVVEEKKEDKENKVATEAFKEKEDNIIEDVEAEKVKEEKKDEDKKEEVGEQKDEVNEHAEENKEETERLQQEALTKAKEDGQKTLEELNKTIETAKGFRGEPVTKAKDAKTSLEKVLSEGDTAAITNATSTAKEKNNQLKNATTDFRERKETENQVRAEIDATIEKYQGRLEESDKTRLENLKKGISNRTSYPSVASVQTAWNLESNKLKDKYDTNNAEGDAANELEEEQNVKNNEEEKVVVEEKKEEVVKEGNEEEKKEEIIENVEKKDDEEQNEEVVEDEKEEVIEEEEEKNGDVAEKKKEEVNEHADENKEHLQQETSTEQKKTELVKGLKDNSLVYSSKGEVKGFESDIYVAMKNAKILDLSEKKQKQMLTDAIKDVLSESSEEQIASFANATIDKFSSAKNQEDNQFKLKSVSGITDRSSVVKQIQVKDKIDELSDTYGGTMSKDSKGKLDELKTQASGATKEKLADIEETLKETEETLKKEAEQYNNITQSLAKINDTIDGMYYDEKDTDALSQKYDAIKSKMSSGNFDLTQVENEIKELKDLVDQVNKEEINLKQVKFDGETGSWKGTIANLYNCLKNADFDIHRIENLDDWQESCKKALKAMTVEGDTLEIPKAWWFGTTCGTEKTDYEHKAMLKTLALFAMELDRKIDKGTAKTFANEVTTVEDGKIKVNASAPQVKISEIKGNNITLKEFVEGKK